jgi:hypothetical protein
VTLSWDLHTMNSRNSLVRAWQKLVKSEREREPSLLPVAPESVNSVRAILSRPSRNSSIRLAAHSLSALDRHFSSTGFPVGSIVPAVVFSTSFHRKIRLPVDLPELPGKETFTWAALNFQVQRWTYADKSDEIHIQVDIYPVSEWMNPYCYVRRHKDDIEFNHYSDDYSWYPKNITEGCRLWLASDYQSQMTLESFLMKVFP